ncbi:c-type cytochrome [Sedimenticola hydrogenitrophicus]|uniref:c-type cytochrome n=1 Tax=Sedimenticola hydrogenitrophicus TaxID=2967975 RepID=UPI0023AF3E0A|nr:cytochrome c [Sedimenticola hydrogenitrophicus]
MKRKTFGLLLTALLLHMGGAARAAQTAGEGTGQSPNGARIYHDYCSVCHGDRGDARSRARDSFLPPPRDFTTPQSARELSRNRMIFSVTYGRPNTAMAGWGTQLKPQEVIAVVDYMREAFMRLPDSASAESAAPAEEDKMIRDGRFDPAYMAQPMPHGLVGEAAWGKLFYESSCAVCHGVTGDGNGPRAYFILPRPRDYRHPAARHKLNRERLFNEIASGSHGSEMPAWDKVLTYQEIAHVSEYIFNAFIQPEVEAEAGSAETDHPHADGEEHAHPSH